MEQDNNKILNLCKELNLAEGKQTEEYLFTLQMVDLFYYKGNIGKIDIKTGFTDGTGDGGVDFIYTDDEVMYLIQGKTSVDLTIEDISNIFYKMKNTVENFRFSLEKIKNIENSKNILNNNEKNQKIKILIVTNDYHIFRSKNIARKVGFDNENYEIYGLPAKTPIISIPKSYFREFLSNVNYFIFQSGNQLKVK